MDTIALLLKLLHVALALALTAGVVGRWIVLHRAAESLELSQTVSLLETVRAAHWAELIGFGVIVALMVLKPF